MNKARVKADIRLIDLHAGSSVPIADFAVKRVGFGPFMRIESISEDPA